MNIIINPGTETDETATLENALYIAKELAKLYKEEVPTLKLKRNEKNDYGGWYGFILTDGNKSVEVDIPGDNPETVMKGEPFKSRRLYVDGSSWLWGYALGSIDGILLDKGE
jgi:hypothetical protein